MLGGELGDRFLAHAPHAIVGGEDNRSELAARPKCLESTSALGNGKIVTFDLAPELTAARRGRALRMHAESLCATRSFRALRACSIQDAWCGDSRGPFDI